MISYEGLEMITKSFEEAEEEFIQSWMARHPAEELLCRFGPEERLRGLSRSEVEAYLARLDGEESDKRH